jgi:transcriptional regulator with PAS, ATPase and Fis domain
LPAIISEKENSNDFNSEREILYKVLFDMKGDLNDLKKLTMELMESSNISEFKENNEHLIKKIYNSRAEKEISDDQIQVVPITEQRNNNEKKSEFDYAEEINAESLSIHDKELELIKKSLEKHKGRRKLAAKELGISERTLYRKIKQFNL